MRIVLITVCKNEKRLLPFFFRHYEGIVDEYVFFDNGSTDGTTELIRQQANTRLIEFNTLGYYKEETLTFIRNSAYRQLRCGRLPRLRIRPARRSARDVPGARRWRRRLGRRGPTRLAGIRSPALGSSRR